MASAPDEIVLEVQSDTWESYWRRVGAWSSELARIPGTGQAVISHQPLMSVLDSPKRAEFLEALGIEIATPEPEVAKPDPQILELAHALDDHLAWEPFLEDDSEIAPFAEIAFSRLRCVGNHDLELALGSLPVFPVAAQRALQLLTRENWKAADLESIAASDQVLAADLIRVANSCTFGARQPITTLGHAIAYLGAENASGILIAASVRRLFAPKRLWEIWNHSLEASEMARGLARLSRQANPEEAFLAGLVHDIGRLAMALLPEHFQARAAHLRREGCELSLVEQVLCGATHAEIGATALERWRFPRSLVEAVRFHHRPEQTSSALAAVLYLTERAINPEEGPPSLARSKAALGRLRLKAGSHFRLDAGRRLDPLRFQA